MIKYAIAFTVGCLLAVGVFIRIAYPPTKNPTPAQWQSALSNNAAAYFRAGVACGVTVERMKPNEVPGIVHANARAYFSSLGIDPYLNPGEGKQTKLDRTLAQTKTVTNIVSTNNQNTP